MYDYGYGYDSYDYGSAASAVGIFAGVGIFMWIIGMAVAVFSIISMWKLFTKAGKKGWAAIVPIYNMIVMIEIAELPMWYIALFFVPFANIYAMFKIYIEIAHKFGKSTGFGVGMVFLSVIFIPMLAFGKAEYKGSVGVPVNNNVNEVTNMQVNQPMMNSNVPNMNNQPDIMNVNGNVGSTSMIGNSVQSNGNMFEPVGNVNNNVNGINTDNNMMSSVNNNLVEPINNNIVESTVVNEAPVMPATEPVVPNVQEASVMPNNGVVNPVDNNVIIPAPVVPNVSTDNVASPEPVNPTMSDMKKTCPNCGNQLQFDAMFCTNCGHNL